MMKIFNEKNIDVLHEHLVATYFNCETQTMLKGNKIIDYLQEVLEVEPFRKEIVENMMKRS
jgi:hypothetical protein